MVHSLVDPASCTAFADFPLAWRFSPQRQPQAETETLARLKPLNSHTAARLAEHAAGRCNGGPFALTTRSDDPPGAVRAWLLDLPIDMATVVTLSWDRATALATDWAFFVSHWDDFCYPASDDVTIWSLTGDWTLCYRRFEVFQYRPSSQV